uniref:Golgi associated, gamma adaptin ear containing, ARF binding protein 3a n=1 Tax=Oncorhynchus tshawytscha TaxID=74940 RepID=A0A8C8G8P0_ONCTS
MADAEGESLESWLNKATNPSNRQEDWEYIIGFCDQINKELEGPQIAVRLLAHKIQSPQEWEAIQALMVLEACMKNCGKRFHNEVGKFRFLNELIKVVSPKYLGDRVSEVVKKRVVDMLFSWTLSLPDEAKISEAYQMLKKQGIVTVDPEVPLDKTLMLSPPSWPKNPVFENEEKSKRLAELLKSKKPEDLQEANRLIKNMVKEDEVRLQRASKRSGTLEEVNNSVKLLNEMLSHFSRDQSTDGDKELIKELYGDCDKLRGTVFKLATETEDNDSSLGDILQASDDLSRVINTYKRIVEGQNVNGEMETLGPSTTTQCKNMRAPNPVLDLFGSALPATVFSAASTTAASLDQLGTSTTEPVSKTAAPVSYPQSSVAASLPYPSAAALAVSASLNHSLQDLAMLDLGSPKRCLSPLPIILYVPVKARWMGGREYSFNVHPSVIIYYSMSGVINTGDLFGMGEAMGATASPRIGIPASRSSPLPLGILPAAAAAAPTLSPKTQADDSPLLRSLSPILILPLGQASPAKFPEISLSNVHVPLEVIKPSKLCPVTAYDKDGVRVLLHFATDCPPGRPDVLVMVVSMLNTAPLPVRNIVLQAAVPKSMKVRLQPPSGTDLAPFNPIFPPTAITQVMLLANPLMEKVRMRYKLTFTLGEQQCTETGEVDQFPPAEIWGAL